MAQANEYGYNVIFQQEDDAVVATVPALNYISTYGDTLEEARLMAKEMIEVYLESLKEDGIEPPEPDAITEIITERISVAVA